MLEMLNQNPFFSGGLSLMVVGSAAALLRHLPAQIWSFLQRRFSITIEIPDRDPAFRWLQVWLASQPYAHRARDLSLATTWVPVDADSETAVVFDPDEGGSKSGASRVKFLLSPAPGTHWMVYQNRLVVLNRSRRDLQNGNARTFQETLSLQVLGGSRGLIEQLLGDAQQLACPRVPGVSILTTRYESWETTSWQPRRPLRSLVLADGVFEDVLEDLREFYGSRTWYTERGVPYRRGYLLHGPPGNGKTTLVLAAAGELNLSVAVLSLSNRLLSDDALRTLVDALPPATVLLIEDVDCVFKTERTTTDQTGVTLSGLLNALDGVSSREGRILFLTTNHPERLDAALVRPGRVDKKIELGNATRSQAKRLYGWFYQGCGLTDARLDELAERFAAQVPEGKVCMAAVQEHLLRHRGAPEAAAHEVDFGDVAPALSSNGKPTAALVEASA
ncbi:MAG: AAA family ATPase [Paludisphaera borealis]|uniref:mitochondrial chaperone BCS1 n=1 Tax=Paludisphaera borealis TaxID=1387353 RepID=UPI00284B595A|nr:AAA family ATPase [Paludisphaera borealis]MDR3621700.1 AAA family ATPase [Paludisphaera borealis]